MSKTIAWVVNRFDTMGGGERLIQEGARYYRSIGYRVLVITWHYDGVVLFNGEYQKLDIINLGAREISRGNIVKRAAARAVSLPRLRSCLRQNKVETVFVQGEYDVALVYLALLWSGIKYRFLIFGQIFQYPHDNAKYSWIFKKHLQVIINSCRGYRDTISPVSQKLSLPNRAANEFISLVRWFAVRAAEKRFTFSRQVDWETGLLFGAITLNARGAFRESLLTKTHHSADTLAKHGLKSQGYLLSLSRLDRKKRIDVIIRAFAKAEISQNTILVIGGAGGDESFLKEVAANSGAADRINFIGLVAEQDLITLKQECAAFLSMDIGDYDISPLEALAIGTPVICPTEFDPGPVLSIYPDFHICEAEHKKLAAKIEQVVSQAKMPNRMALRPLSWEAYFITLMAE